MRRLASNLLPLMLLSGTLLAPGIARADRIDGEWCGPDSRSLMIDGPAIRTPTGAETIGDYDRHSFRYSGPAGDPEAGTEIFMVLRGEEEMWLRRRIGGVDGEQEVWRRCRPVS